MTRIVFAVMVVGACTADGGVDPEDVDDHAVAALVLEEQALTAFFAGGESAAVEVAGGFRRLGLLWDAADAAAIEARTSVDGTTWSAWTAPVVVHGEAIAHAGHVDALAVGDAGSAPDDPAARHYQLRVAAGRAAPTFLAVEPLPDIPARLADEVVADRADADEASPYFSDVYTTPIGSLRIYSRAEWGARAPRCSYPTHTPNRVTIHHTVTPTNDTLTPQARLRQIQSFHMFTNGWCDIGYNHLMSRDGRVWRGRGAGNLGAHVANNNSGNVGISFMGTHTTTAPTPEQMCQAAKFLRFMRKLYPAIDMNRTDVKGHRQYGGTSCPGDALYNRIDAILRKARGGCAVN